MKLQMGMWLIVCALAAAGCGHVERYIVVQTDPPGAPAWVDEEYVGLTPVTYEFQHYGRRRIRVGPIREAAEEEPAGTLAEAPAAADGHPALHARGKGERHCARGLRIEVLLHFEHNFAVSGNRHVKRFEQGRQPILKTHVNHGPTYADDLTVCKLNSHGFGCAGCEVIAHGVIGPAGGNMRPTFSIIKARNAQTLADRPRGDCAVVIREQICSVAAHGCVVSPGGG